MLVTRAPGSKPKTSREELAKFLRDRRERIDPRDCGFRVGRRRTPGLRREEVAQLAGVSVTWYTWLEQGGRSRKAEPSADALDGIARALRLDRAEREHLFLLAHGRPPARVPGGDVEVPLALRSLIDNLGATPAIVRTLETWDVVAWNDAAVAVLGDYANVPPGQRNALRRLFLDPGARERLLNWEQVARRLVAAVRGDRARAGATPAGDALIAEISTASPEFARWWAEDGEVAQDADGIKRFNHPIAGPLTLTYATLAPAANDGLTVTMFVPATPADRAAIERLLAIK